MTEPVGPCRCYLDPTNCCKGGQHDFVSNKGCLKVFRPEIILGVQPLIGGSKMNQFCLAFHQPFSKVMPDSKKFKHGRERRGECEREIERDREREGGIRSYVFNLHWLSDGGPFKQPSCFYKELTSL